MKPIIHLQGTNHIGVFCILFVMIAFFAVPEKAASFDTDNGSINKELDEFDKIRLKGNYSTRIEPSERFHITMKGSDRNLGRVNARVEDGVLIVDQKDSRNWWDYSASSVELLIESPTWVSELHVSGFNSLHMLKATNLQSLRVEGAGKVEIDDITTDFLFIESNGASDIKGKGIADELDISISGASSLNLDNVISQKATVNAGGVCRVNIHVKENLVINSGGISQINYSGSPANVETRSGGFSRVQELE